MRRHQSLAAYMVYWSSYAVSEDLPTGMCEEKCYGLLYVGEVLRAAVCVAQRRTRPAVHPAISLCIGEERPTPQQCTSTNLSTESDDAQYLLFVCLIHVRENPNRTRDIQRRNR